MGQVAVEIFILLHPMGRFGKQMIDSMCDSAVNIIRSKDSRFPS